MRRFHGKMVALGDGPMANKDLAVCVSSERPMIGLERYDLSVYRISGEFYATWFCTICGDVHETSRRGGQPAAQDEAWLRLRPTMRLCMGMAANS
jgi:hypothetical protein